MVKTRGLGRALGRAIGKALGRRDVSDDDAPNDEGLLHQPIDSDNKSEHLELKLSSHGRKMAKFGRPVPQIEGLVAASGLSPLIACSLDTGDRGLMSAFVEH
ncbi:hypothetical protein GmHk_06G016711 [Glycine max]|nr:hypothetical protein GmHk_06G016711 [Glycine max]